MRRFFVVVCVLVILVGFVAVVRDYLRYHPAETPSQAMAREIMGQDYFGPGEAMKYFGVDPTPEQLRALAEVPFSQETLEKAKGKYVLVASFPITLVSIMEAKMRFTGQDESVWFGEKDFALDPGRAGWWLIRKTSVPGSEGLTWSDQRELVGTGIVPDARVMAYAILGHAYATGERLFADEDVRTSTPTGDLGTCHVIVGFSVNPQIINLSSLADGRSRVGIASAIVER